jgi:hypothetical protein
MMQQRAGPWFPHHDMRRQHQVRHAAAAYPRRHDMPRILLFGIAVTWHSLHVRCGRRRASAAE